jgi:hypothetical protein
LDFRRAGFAVRRVAGFADAAVAGAERLALDRAGAAFAGFARRADFAARAGARRARSLAGTFPLRKIGALGQRSWTGQVPHRGFRAMQVCRP